MRWGSRPAALRELPVTVTMPEPIPSPITVAFGADTNVGHRRTTNQDALLAHGSVFVVADGMGGHVDGDYASATVVNTFDALTNQSTVTLAQLQATFAESVLAVAALPVGGGAGAGTTLTGVMITEVRNRVCWLVLNIGDSRCYLLRAGVLRQITVDHSVVQQQLDAGEITAAQAAVSPQRNIVTRSIGAGSHTEPDYWVVAARVGDRLLVCSDGLTNELSHAHIALVLLAESNPQAAARRLVSQALLHGGRDNVTVIVVDAVTVLGNEAPDDTVPRDEAVLAPVPPVNPAARRRRRCRCRCRYRYRYRCHRAARNPSAPNSCPSHHWSEPHMNRYTPGPWFAVVTEHALALLPSDVAPEIVERLWATLTSREGFGAALEALTGQFGTNLALIPSFAIVVVGDDGGGAAEARIAVRGPLAVYIEGDAELGQVRVSGARVTTWSEILSTSPASIEIVTDAVGEEGPLLPIERGVVGCSSIFMTLRDSAPDLVPDVGSDLVPGLVPELLNTPARTGDPLPSVGSSQVSAYHPVSARLHTNAAVFEVHAVVPGFDDDHDGETISVEQLLRLGHDAPSGIVPNSPTLTPVLAGVLLMSSGGEVLLDRGAIIGRKPSAGTFLTGTMPHLVTVPSPQQDISRSHVEVRCEGLTVVAVDLGTTNGTRLLRGGQAAARLNPQEPTILVHGDVLDLGDEVRVTFVEAS
ncbi:protein phosphatase 2C domain-containing protein [Cryobacterium sp. MLB-32]|uniref:protein phosphatase 2C domain-containing protein n=1 Tax=Cryobacterium sp. MLB-32 TaxID=1529318 RepID=UPI00068F4C51|nr:protein phosphatase 2C domain-containing protein [Cryobacterium sp. MLB-32]